MNCALTRSGYRNSVDAGELLSRTLLDHDVSSALQTQIAGRAGRRHVKRYPVMLGSDGQLIRAHFVGRVAVGNNPVRSDDDSCVRTGTLTSDTPDTHTTLKPMHSTCVTCDALLPHGERRHAVCDEGGREPLGHGLVRRQPGALVVGPGLCTVQTLQAAQRMQRPHHSCTDQLQPLSESTSR